MGTVTQLAFPASSIASSRAGLPSGGTSARRRIHFSSPSASIPPGSFTSALSARRAAPAPAVPSFARYSPRSRAFPGVVADTREAEADHAVARAERVEALTDGDGRSDFDRLRRGLYVGRPDDPTLGMTSENGLEPGEDTPRPDVYQLYRAADRTSPPPPVIAQAGCTRALKLIVRPKQGPTSGVL